MGTCGEPSLYSHGSKTEISQVREGSVESLNVLYCDFIRKFSFCVTGAFPSVLPYASLSLCRNPGGVRPQLPCLSALCCASVDGHGGDSSAPLGWAGTLPSCHSLSWSSCRSDHQRSASEERGLCAELPALGGCQMQDCWVWSMETRQTPMFTSLVSADIIGRGPYMRSLFKQFFVSVYLVLLQFTTTELDRRACYFLG